MQPLTAQLPTRLEMNRALKAGASNLRATSLQAAPDNSQAQKAVDSIEMLVDKVAANSNSVKPKYDIRQALGKFRSCFAPEAPTEIRRSYEKLRNLALDNTIERLEKGGSYPGKYFTTLPLASDIANFNALSPTYLRGGQPDQEGISWLVNAGVKSVIDLRASDKNNAWHPPVWKPIKTFEIGIEDFQAPSIEQVEKFLSIVDNPDNKPSFVHCKAGIGRTGVLTACWNIAHGMSADEALKQEAISSYDGSLRQEAFVREFEAYWQSKATEPTAQRAGTLAA